MCRWKTSWLESWSVSQLDFFTEKGGPVDGGPWVKEKVLIFLVYGLDWNKSESLTWSSLWQSLLLLCKCKRGGHARKGTTVGELCESVDCKPARVCPGACQVVNQGRYEWQRKWLEDGARELTTAATKVCFRICLFSYLTGALLSNPEHAPSPSENVLPKTDCEVERVPPDLTAPLTP